MCACVCVCDMSSWPNKKVRRSCSISPFVFPPQPFGDFAPNSVSSPQACHTTTPRMNIKASTTQYICVCATSQDHEHGHIKLLPMGDTFMQTLAKVSHIEAAEREREQGPDVLFWEILVAKYQVNNCPCPCPSRPILRWPSPR